MLGLHCVAVTVSRLKSLCCWMLSAARHTLWSPSLSWWPAVPPLPKVPPKSQNSHSSNSKCLWCYHHGIATVRVHLMNIAWELGGCQPLDQASGLERQISTPAPTVRGSRKKLGGSGKIRECKSTRVHKLTKMQKKFWNCCMQTADYLDLHF